ncbi:MAG: histidine phosphatase family protein [Verrucomicrobiota bacterium]|nr:histidine phosphatase family protein [Verrucomicrobiota bacterium]
MRIVRSMLVYLLRHGNNDLVGKKLAGRIPGVFLNEEGRAQARSLAEELGNIPFAAVISSPLERTLETAAPLAEKRALRIEIADAILEYDFGTWNGKSLEELRSDPNWANFNTHRTSARPVGGEHMLEVQTRAVTFLEHRKQKHRDSSIALVTHADVIRAVLCFYLGMPLDLFNRIEISPGSYTMLELSEWSPRVLGMNCIPKPL